MALSTNAIPMCILHFSPQARGGDTTRPGFGTVDRTGDRTVDIILDLD